MDVICFCNKHTVNLLKVNHSVWRIFVNDEQNLKISILQFI